MLNQSTMKNFLKKLFAKTGYEIRKINHYPPGSDLRPIGNYKNILEDLKHRNLQCKTVLDIGANNTAWSIMAKSVFTESNFFLIEPQIEKLEELKAFCDANPGSEYILAGAGAEKGELTLTVWDDLAGSSFLPHEDPSLVESGKQRKIDIITVDDLIADGKIPIPELIKLDIQGFELEALKGASSVFGKTEIIILEVSLIEFSDVPGQPEMVEVINFMHERGYIPYDFPGFLRRPLDGALGQCDICFVKKDSFLRRSHEWS